MLIKLDDTSRYALSYRPTRNPQLDLSQEYWLDVFEPAIEAWQAGSTPNPDVSCNKHVKFGALMDKALPSDSGWLATGTLGVRTKMDDVDVEKG